MKNRSIVVVIAGFVLFSAISAYGDAIVSWGANGFGQTDAQVGSDFIAVAAGGNHNIAIKSDGSLVGWGNNSDGQIGVPAGNDFVAISGGEDYSLAIKSDGSLSAWGLNGNGQRDVPNGNDFVAITAGDAYGIALRSNHSLIGWGKNDLGQTDVPSGNIYMAISTSYWNHIAALKMDGTLVSWGASSWDEDQVPSGNDFIAVSTGSYYTLGLRLDGSLAAAGYDASNQLDTPSGNDFVDIAGGRFSGYAITSSGSISGEKCKCEVTRIGRSYWLQLFLIRRILRINAHVPWPVHWSSTVSSVNNIHLKTYPPFPGLGPGQYIQAMNGIYIGENVRMGPGVKLISANHSVSDFEQHDSADPIVLGNYCWLGANSIILPGVRLGNHVIVAAGAVVTKSFDQDDVLIGGVPARQLKTIRPYTGGLPENIYFCDSFKSD